MPTPPYEYVSADSHLEVSPDQWRPFVDKEFREYVPKVIKLDNGGDAWQMPGNGGVIPLGLNFSAGRGWENIKPTGISYAEGLRGAGDGSQRLEEMDVDGIYAEILFPAVAGQRGLDGCGIPREAYVGIELEVGRADHGDSRDAGLGRVRREVERVDGRLRAAVRDDRQRPCEEELEHALPLGDGEQDPLAGRPEREDPVEPARGQVLDIRREGTLVERLPAVAQRRHSGGERTFQHAANLSSPA